MKKLGIAVFSLMFVGVAYVGAQTIEVDFDGEKAIQNGQDMEKFSMPEAFSDIEYNIPAPIKEINYEFAKKKTSACTECTIEGTKLQNLRRKILIKSGLLKKEKALRLIEDEKTIILYNYENVFFANKLGEHKYNIIWESSDKQLVEHLANKERQIIYASSTNKGLIKICFDVLVKILVIKEGIETWEEVTTRICEFIEENPAPDNDADQADDMVDGLLY